MNERILCAAVWVNSPFKFDHARPVNKDHGIVVCGLRHCDCFLMLSWLPEHVKGEDAFKDRIQGFLTSDNRFVDRYEALDIANWEKQIPGIKHSPKDQLCSEDMY